MARRSVSPGQTDQQEGEEMTHVSDIRSTSYDPRYAGIVFGGVDTIDETIQQAKYATTHVHERRPGKQRRELEQFLRVPPKPKFDALYWQRRNLVESEAERDSLIV